jgi:hypothetical protein
MRSIAMKHRIVFLLSASLLFVTWVPALQASDPAFIDGDVYGVELCPQDLCGSAVFVGLFGGRIDGRYQFGVVGVGVTHDALPEPGFSSAITGGLWKVQTRRHEIRGQVLEGRICAHADNTFTVTANLVDTEGGLHYASVELDHNVFPPTIQGYLTSARDELCVGSEESD